MAWSILRELYSLGKLSSEIALYIETIFDLFSTRARDMIFTTDSRGAIRRKALTPPLPLSIQPTTLGAKTFVFSFSLLREFMWRQAGKSPSFLSGSNSSSSSCIYIQQYSRKSRSVCPFSALRTSLHGTVNLVEAFPAEYNEYIYAIQPSRSAHTVYGNRKKTFPNRIKAGRFGDNISALSKAPRVLYKLARERSEIRAFERISFGKQEAISRRD